jgi:3-isopropylmalate/(R)-2-methylmalate dehydratase small subunit
VGYLARKINYSGKVFPLNRDNVDTDQIIPKQFLKRIERKGFGQFLFFHWRFEDKGGKLKQDFLLNSPRYKNSKILLSGKNFGCGSSREHAPWALQDFGFNVVIAESFADIFYNNCLKNGILPIKLSSKEIEKLFERATEEELMLEVSLENQTVQDSKGFYTTFEVDPYWKTMLLEGLDEIDLTLKYEEKIRQFENK